MTRINIVPVSELCNKHLFAEWREIPRVISSLEKSLNRKNKKFDMMEIPPSYVLGKGHVKFFFNKLTYVINRYDLLSKELLIRNYNISIRKLTIPKEIPLCFINDWKPSQNELEINRKRIKERLPKNPKWK